MAASSGSHQAGLLSEVTPAPTLRGPRDVAFDVAKAKLADKTALKDFFLAKEIWSLANILHTDKAKHGTPVSLIHSLLRTFFGQHRVDWEAFLGGGMLGKVMTDAIQERRGKGEKPIDEEPFACIDGNVLPGQTGAQKAAKLTVKRKNKKGEPRDQIYYTNGLKYRRGLVLNPGNITGRGDAAVFRLPFNSPEDSSATPALKALLAHLKVVDLSKLSFNIDEKTRAPEAGLSGTDQNSPPASSSPSSSAAGLKPFVGLFDSADLLEIYVQPLSAGALMKTEVERHGPGPDCSKSLVITGSFGGTICDEVLRTGKDEEEMDLHITRTYSELVHSTFPSSEWELRVPLPSDVDTRAQCRGFKRLASGTLVFTAKKKKTEPTSQRIAEPW